MDISKMTPQEIYELAKKLFNGDGVEKDLEKAVDYWRIAAEKGHAKAQHNLGVSYFNGEGVGKDLEKAVYWWTKAAEQGDAKALNNLVAFYRDGEGVDRFTSSTFESMLKAAVQGNDEEQYYLGACYYIGYGVEKEYERAIYWWTKGAEQGFAAPQYLLGKCYDEGTGVDRDESIAFKYFLKAAEQKMPEALMKVGLYYHNGKGGAELNLEKAKEYFEKAAEQGSEDAKPFLEQFENKGKSNSEAEKEQYEAKIAELERQLAEKNNITALIEKMLSNQDLMMSNQDLMMSDLDTVKSNQDLIINMLKSLDEDIKVLKSRVERELSEADGDFEREPIIDKFVNKCIEKIEKKKDDAEDEDKSFCNAEIEIKGLLGDNVWGKMEIDSKNWITSARFLYEKMSPLELELDYSGVCLLASKAVENELHKRFYKRFKEYAESLELEIEDYPYILLKRNSDKPKVAPPQHFTLGSVNYALVPDNPHFVNVTNIPEDKREKSATLVRNFIRDELMDGADDEAADSYRNNLAIAVDKIVFDFRNPCAHTKSINKTTALDCLEYIIEVEQVLKKMLENIK